MGTKQVRTPRPAIYLIKHVQHELQASVERALGKTRLTPSQVAVLSALSSQPGLSNADLARLAFVKPQTMVPLLSAVERRGLIVRKPHPSGGRAMPATLTPKGVATLHSAREILKRLEDEMLADLDARKIRQLTGALEKCLARLRARIARPRG
jgi:DNA-binding MarR family transcriptional regulator